jgi:hypothetical protein
MAGTLKPISDPSGIWDVYWRPQPNSPRTIPQRGPQTLAFDLNKGKLTVGSTPYQYAGAKQQKLPDYGTTQWVDMYNSTKNTILVLKTNEFENVFVTDDRGNGHYVSGHGYTIYTYPLNQTDKLLKVTILCPVGILC